MFVEAVFESSFGFSYVLFGAVVALYHANDVFGVTVNVIRDRSGFACSFFFFPSPPQINIMWLLFSSLI